MEKRKFRLADVVLSVICVVFVAEAAAPVASIGNSQYFWWLFMIIAFLLPELGLLGAGLSTMLSRVMMFVVAFAIFMISKRYKVYSRSFREARLSGEAFRQVSKQSWPVSLAVIATPA